MRIHRYQHTRLLSRPLPEDARATRQGQEELCYKESFRTGEKREEEKVVIADT